MKRILVVDDSRTEQFMLKAILERHGYEYMSADEGEKGIEQAKTEKPDLILMDIIMPGLNGFQTVRKLKKDPDTQAIPVIMVSTKSEMADRAWATKQGAEDLVAKPVNEQELLAKIENFLSE